MALTIRQWFESVKEQNLRDKLLKAMNPDYADCQERSLSHAIMGGFSWDEDYSYWKKIDRCAELGEIELSEPRTPNAK